MKILHITYGFNGGGVGFVIANYCANQPMPGIAFDIVGESIGKPHLLQERFEKAGFHTFYVTPKKQSLLKNIKEMRRVIQQGHYDAVHVHFEEWSFLYLWIAKLCGVKVRVCHAHMAYMTGASAKPHYRLFRVLLNRFATLRLACSKDAGDHLYGKQFVVGVVGRLTYQKNPQFTVEIFAKVKEKRPNAVLMFVGQGELEEETRRMVQAKGLTDSVLFLGLRTDVPDLMQAMDAFVLPSRFEGLGIVYIEAQAAGLKTFATAEVVPQEACVDESLFTYLPREATAQQWADAMLAADTTQRENKLEVIQSHGYDIHQEAEKLRALYLKGKAEGEK